MDRDNALSDGSQHAIRDINPSTTPLAAGEQEVVKANPSIKLPRIFSTDQVSFVIPVTPTLNLAAWNRVTLRYCFQRWLELTRIGLSCRVADLQQELDAVRLQSHCAEPLPGTSAKRRLRQARSNAKKTC